MSGVSWGVRQLNPIFQSHFSYWAGSNRFLESNIGLSQLNEKGGGKKRKKWNNLLFAKLDLDWMDSIRSATVRDCFFGPTCLLGAHHTLSPVIKLGIHHPIKNEGKKERTPSFRYDKIVSALRGSVIYWIVCFVRGLLREKLAPFRKILSNAYKSITRTIGSISESYFRHSRDFPGPLNALQITAWNNHASPDVYTFKYA